MPALRRTWFALGAPLWVACTTLGDVLELADGDGSGEGATAADASGTADGGTEADGTAGSGCGAGDPALWCPAPGLTWQNQRIGVLDFGEVADVYAMPLFLLDTTAVAALHGQGRRVICWFSAGTTDWDDPDREALLPAAGDPVIDGQPKLWLDIRDPVVRSATLSRLDTAVALGCDALEPGDLDGWRQTTGFALNRQDTVDHLRWLADNAHARGLSIALQDGLDLASDVHEDLDFAIDYHCLADGTCDRLQPFVDADKVVFHVELVDPLQSGQAATLAMQVCPASAAASLITIFKKPDLNSWRYSCD